MKRTESKQRNCGECGKPARLPYALNNPWWRITAAKLQAAGGKHAKSTVATDRSVIAEQPAVDLAREVAELQSEPGCHSPF